MKKYTFFEVLEPINGITGKNEKQDVIKLLEPGEIVMMVGKGIVSPKLPIGTMHMLAHKPLLEKKGLKVIEDKETIKESVEAFEDIIKEIEKETTTAFLEMIEIHSEFIKVPSKLKNYVKKLLGYLGSAMAKLIVLEGTDSSGKETHTRLLEEYLIEKGYKVIRRSFPNYKSGASFPIKAYLRGDYGKDANLINPYAISVMFAVDRYASFKTDWQKFMKEDETVILFDRYVQSNMIHQMSKLKSESEGKEFLKWLDDLEFVKMRLPRPDKVFLLNMPINLAMQLKKGRANKITGEEEQDIHENNRKHLEKSYESALIAKNIYNWEEIKCSKSDIDLRSINEIQKELRDRINNLLD